MKAAPRVALWPGSRAVDYPAHGCRVNAACWHHLKNASKARAPQQPHRSGAAQPGQRGGGQRGATGADQLQRRQAEQHRGQDAPWLVARAIYSHRGSRLGGDCHQRDGKRGRGVVVPEHVTLDVAHEGQRGDQVRGKADGAPIHEFA